MCGTRRKRSLAVVRPPLIAVTGAGLVRGGSTSDATWTAELLLDLPPQERPDPFTEPEHTFTSLDEARTWLGGAEVLEV